MRIDNPEIQITGSANPGTRQSISYISRGHQAGIILVADGKIYAIKGNNSNNDFYAAAAWPNAFDSSTRTSINNMYEIPIPGETGALLDCKANGAGAYALFNNGNLYTWGYNVYGWCGTGNTTPQYYPILAQTGVTEVYTHPSNNSGESLYSRLLIKKTDGKIYGTGYNQNYELGLGNTTDRTSFTELAWAGTNPISVWNIGAWGGHIIVQKSDGTLAMSGYNTNGQLGISGNTTTPTVATSASSAAWLNNDTTYRIEEVLFGGRWFNGSWQQSLSNLSILFRNASGTRFVTAGNNNYGSVGDGTTTQRTVPTVPTGTWNTIRKVAISGAGAAGAKYILKEDGTLWAWGDNDNGQADSGTQTDVITPQLVETGVTNIFPLIQNWLYSYLQAGAIIEKADGYYSIGYNGQGESGTGLTTNPLTRYTRILLPGTCRLKMIGSTSTVNQVNTMYAVTTNDEIWAWGSNGNLNIDTTADHAWQPIRFAPPVLQR